MSESSEPITHKEESRMDLKVLRPVPMKDGAEPKGEMKHDLIAQEYMDCLLQGKLFFHVHKHDHDGKRFFSVFAYER